MKNQTALQIFEHDTFGKIRTIIIDGEPWFIGKEIADILGYVNPRDALNSHVDVEDKNTVAIRDGIRGNLNKTIINESGLYNLIMSSKLPQARAFRRWITSSVIPSIRKHGAYITDDTLGRMMGDSEFTEALMDALLEENARYQKLFAESAALNEKNVLLERDTSFFIRHLTGAIDDGREKIGQEVHDPVQQKRPGTSAGCRHTQWLA